MAEDGNHICGVCHRAAPAWRCACSALHLCATCLASHCAAASASPHSLVPVQLEVWVTSEEAERSSRAYDTALGLAKYFEEEKASLEARKTDLIAAIETETCRICAETRTLAETLKQKVAEETTKLLLYMDEFKSLDFRSHVLKAKSDRFHLLSLTLHTEAFDFKKTMSLSVTIPAEKTYRHLEKSGIWSFNGEKIDALTIQVSKKAFLSGIVLGRPTNPMSFPEIKLFEVRNGDSTLSPVLYTHPPGQIVAPGRAEKPVVRFSKPIKLLPERKYTVKAVMLGGGVVSGTAIGGNRGQEGLEVTGFDAQLGPTEVSNGTSANSGIFFEFLYIP